MDKRRKKQFPNQLTIRDAFTYDAATGHLKWGEHAALYAHCKKPGEIAGGKDGRGGWRVKFLGSQYNLRDLVWIYHNGDLPPSGVMHGNLDPMDNRIENITERAPRVTSEGVTTFM